MGIEDLRVDDLLVMMAFYENIQRIWTEAVEEGDFNVDENGKYFVFASDYGKCAIAGFDRLIIYSDETIELLPVNDIRLDRGSKNVRVR